MFDLTTKRTSLTGLYKSIVNEQIKIIFNNVKIEGLVFRVDYMLNMTSQTNAGRRHIDCAEIALVRWT